MNRSNYNETLGGIFVFFLFFVFLGVFNSAQSVGLNVATFLITLAGILVAGFCCYALLYFQWFDEHWPLVLVVVWLAFFPALDYWANGKIDERMREFFPVVWWATWYAKLGVSAVLILGWWLNYLRVR